MKTQAFKIRNPDGLYSTGGTNPRFTKTGKTWNALHHVKSHLTHIVEYCRHNPNVYDGCELVTLEMVESSAEVTISDMLAERLQVKKEKDEAAQKRYQEYKERRERQQLQELSEKYGEG